MVRRLRYIASVSFLEPINSILQVVSPLGFGRDCLQVFVHLNERDAAFFILGEMPFHLRQVKVGTEVCQGVSTPIADGRPYLRRITGANRSKVANYSSIGAK
jgi:hypothetical protein